MANMTERIVSQSLKFRHTCDTFSESKADDFSKNFAVKRKVHGLSLLENSWINRDVCSIQAFVCICSQMGDTWGI